MPEPAKNAAIGIVKTIRCGNSGFGNLALHVLNRAWLNHARRKLMLGAKGFAKSMREKRGIRIASRRARPRRTGSARPSDAEQLWHRRRNARW